jgi:hypothetical protein
MRLSRRILIKAAKRKAIVKRLSIIFILVLCLSSSVFPQGAEAEDDESALSSASPVMPWQESGVAFGLEYGNYWGKSADNVKTHATSFVYHMHQYFIQEGGKSGFSSRLSLGLPNVETINGNRPRYIDYDGWQVGVTGEYFYNHALHKKLSVFYGAGANFVYIKERYAQYVPLTNKEEDFNKKTFNAGLNAGITLRYVNGNIILLAGCIFNYDYAIILKPSETASNSTGIAGNVSVFGVRPFFSIGHTL